MCPIEPSLVGVEGSDRASESGSEVGYSVVFLLGGPVSEVVSMECGVAQGFMGFVLLVIKVLRVN